MIVRRKVNQLLVDGEAICHVDQDGNLTLDSLCNDIVCVVELSPEKLKAAYQEQQKIERTETARSKLAKRFHIDESSNPEGQSTQYKASRTVFGQTFADAIDPTSEGYMLPQLVDI